MYIRGIIAGTKYRSELRKTGHHRAKQPAARLVLRPYGGIMSLGSRQYIYSERPLSMNWENADDITNQATYKDWRRTVASHRVPKFRSIC